MATANKQSQKAGSKKNEMTGGALEVQTLRAAQLREQIESLKVSKPVPQSPRDFTDVRAEEAKSKEQSKRGVTSRKKA